MTDKVLDFVKEVYPQAKLLGGFNPVFVTAQGGGESGWGGKRVGNFNLFGMKCPKGWKGKKVLVTTTEYHDNPNVKYPEIFSVAKQPNGKYKYVVKDWFCDFDSVKDCLEYHFKLLNKPQFKHALEYKNDPIKYVTALQSGEYKYATSPDYVKFITSLIKMVNNAIIILKL